MVFYIICTVIGLLFSFILFFLVSLSLNQSLVNLTLSLLFVFYLIAIIYILIRSTEGRNPPFAGVLVLPPLLVFLILIFVTFIYSEIDKKKKMSENYPIFKEECRNAGAQYYKLPTIPVHSIAYEYDEGHFIYNSYYETAGAGNGKIITIPTPRSINKMSSEYKKTFPVQIEFTEYRNSSGYVRVPRQGASYNIDTLSSDVLVEYKMTPLSAANVELNIDRHDLNIKDRRNGEVLAHLRYIIDKKNYLACGCTQDYEIEEKYFVLKAIGLEK